MIAAMPKPPFRLFAAALLASLLCAAPAMAAGERDRAWRTLDPVALPAPQPILFPAGTLVRMRFVNFGEIRPCLPEQTEPPSRLRYAILNCLADRDGDGRYETVERLRSMIGAHVPMLEPVGTVRLPAPLRLVALPSRDVQ